ncbi:MAG: hypothetical protein ACFBSC_02160 [Microcoleaceae cyanobacterium]
MIILFKPGMVNGYSGSPVGGVQEVGVRGDPTFPICISPDLERLRDIYCH